MPREGEKALEKKIHMYKLRNVIQRQPPGHQQTDTLKKEVLQQYKTVVLKKQKKHGSDDSSRGCGRAHLALELGGQGRSAQEREQQDAPSLWTHRGPEGRHWLYLASLSQLIFCRCSYVKIQSLGPPISPPSQSRWSLAGRRALP